MDSTTVGSISRVIPTNSSAARSNWKRFWARWWRVRSDRAAWATRAASRRPAIASRCHLHKEFTMEYSTLGRTGLRVSRLSLGAMTFGAGSGIWGDIAGLDSDQATRLVAMAVERGVNLIDTADAYSQGRSEEVVGQVLNALGLDESRMLVATKVRLRTGPGHNEVGLGRSHIMRSVETSLKRIGRDHIDLFQLHDRDELVPLEETLLTLDDLV